MLPKQGFTHLPLSKLCHLYQLIHVMDATCHHLELSLFITASNQQKIIVFKMSKYLRVVSLDYGFMVLFRFSKFFRGFSKMFPGF